MRINNNLMAANTHRVLGLNQSGASKAIEKLSSGYRINRAGDDAAGLAISEKMRAQIRGLTQASRNAQDSVSLIQTAEGATGEVHEMLQRMRQLAVQSANDSNTSDDRNKLQNEVDQLIREVDRVADTTEFNNIKLLNGTGGTSNISQSTIDSLSADLPGYINDAMNAVEDYLGFNTPLGKRNMDITYYYDDTTRTGASMGTSDGGASLTLRVNLAGFTDSDGNLKSVSEIDTLIAHEMVHAYQFMNMDFSTDTADRDKETWFLEGLAMAIQGGNLFAVTDHTVTTGTNFDGDYRSAYEAVKVMHELIDGGIKSLVDELENPGRTLDQAIANVTWNAGGTDIGTADVAAGHTIADINDIDSFLVFFNGSTDVDAYLAGPPFNDDFNPTIGSGVIDDGDAKGSHSTKDFAATIANGTGIAEVTASFTLNFTNPNFAGAGGQLSMQIGANEGQSMNVNVGNVTTENLGIQTLDLSTRDNASEAITVIDKAIESVSTIRSRYGALQNRLEHAIKSLDNTTENLQASESRIRDLDMAKGYMDYTKKNILMQAAQSMLAQANQAPQGVLQLLR